MIHSRTALWTEEKAWTVAARQLIYEKQKSWNNINLFHVLCSNNNIIWFEPGVLFSVFSEWERGMFTNYITQNLPFPDAMGDQLAV